MLTSGEVRAHGAVATFDFREKLAEYGLEIGTRADLDKARTLVDQVAADADRIITGQVDDCKKLDQNPYKLSTKINGREVQFALDVRLFDDGSLAERLAYTFPRSDEQPRAPQPRADVIGKRIQEKLSALATEAKYVVIGVELNADSSLARIVLQDPVYADMAMKERGQWQMTDLSEIASALREEDVAKHDMSAQSLGLTAGATPELVKTLRAVRQDLVDTAVRDILVHFQALRASQVSPFRDTNYTLDRKSVLFVGDKLKRGIFEEYIARPAVVASVTATVIVEALRASVPNYGGLVDSTRFCDCVRNAIAQRLRAVPGLPLAAVAYDPYNAQTLEVVFVSTEAALRAQRPGLLRGLFAGKQAALALPAPTSSPADGAPPAPPMDASPRALPKPIAGEGAPFAITG